MEVCSTSKGYICTSSQTESDKKVVAADCGLHRISVLTAKKEAVYVCDDNTPFTTSFHLLSVQTTEPFEFKLFHTKLNRSRITFTHKKLSWQLKGSLSSTEESVEVLDGSYWSSLAVEDLTTHKAQTPPQNKPQTVKYYFDGHVYSVLLKRKNVYN